MRGLFTTPSERLPCRKNFTEPNDRLFKGLKVWFDAYPAGKASQRGVWRITTFASLIINYVNKRLLLHVPKSKIVLKHG